MLQLLRCKARDWQKWDQLISGQVTITKLTTLLVSQKYLKKVLCNVQSYVVYIFHDPAPFILVYRNDHLWHDDAGELTAPWGPGLSHQ